MIKISNWTLVALGVIAAAAACSPAISTPENGDGDGDNSGGTTGSGGANTGVPSGGSLGTTSGGASSSSGGATIGSGGVISTGSGGAVVSGSGGAAVDEDVVCTGTAWSVMNGHVDNGTWCGYGYAAAWDGAEITPTDFKTASELCAAGTAIGIEDDAGKSYPGVEVGFGLKEEGDNKQAWAVSGKGITIDFTATGASGADAVVIKLGLPGSDVNAYQIRLTAAQAASGTLTATWSQFSTEPWEGGAGDSPSAGTEISKIAVSVRGTTVAQTVSELCINNVTLN